MESIFQKWVVDGGLMMIGLVPCLILMIAFVIQGCVNLRRKRLAPADFIERLSKARQDGGMEAARALLETDQHSLAEIIRNVDAHLEFNPEADVAQVLREQIESECDLLIQQNSQLAIIVRVAPQIGLLGTVLGLYDAFSRYAQLSQPDVKALSIGINVALITTIWGLSIAIPAYVAYYMIQRRIAAHEQIVFPRLGAEALHVLRDQSLRASSAALQRASRSTS
jgi:biopolymer transport protein ExbB